MKLLDRKVKSSRPLKVLQFGGGNFLRAYIDWMFDILNEQTDFNGDVLIVKPTEQGDYQALRDQDGLYHVLTNGIQAGVLIQESHLVECVQDVIHPYQEYERFIASAHNPSFKIIVSNTTESGIQYNPEDQLTDQPAKEYPGKLTQWLYARWLHFKGDADKGCLFLPCELIERNGSHLRDCILQYAQHWKLDENFIDWIISHCQFCNTLVDRIVTGYPTERAVQIAKEIDCEDKLLVDAEPYHLLVIEGPEDIKAVLPFDKTDLNVVFTDDLQSHRDIKVRLLNGAHTAMVPVGYLAGVRTVIEAIDHPNIGPYIHNVLLKNIIPTLDFPTETLTNYANDVLDRFKNPFIKHQLIDISLNSISKFKTRLLPSLLEYVMRTDELPDYIIQALAALFVFYKGHYNGETNTLRDSEQTIAFFSRLWTSWDTDQNTKLLVDTILSNEQFWNQDLRQINGLSAALAEQVLLQLAQQSVS